jgi:hypothetical protein
LIPDEQAASHGYVRVVDESGKDYGYAVADFSHSKSPKRWLMRSRYSGRARQDALRYEAHLSSDVTATDAPPYVGTSYDCLQGDNRRPNISFKPAYDVVNEENRIGREKRWAREGDRRPNTLLGAPRVQRPACASKGERVVYSLPKPLGQTARSLAPVEFEAYIPVVAGDLLSLPPRRAQQGPPWPWLSDASRSSTGGRPWPRPRADIAIGITACWSLMLPSAPR